MNNHFGDLNKMVQRSGCGAHIAYAGLAVIALLLCSCWTPKRCNRALLRCGVVSDTIQVWDSIYLERVITDTLLRWDSLRLHDTVTIEQDRVRVKIVRLPGERLYVQGECKDTVVRYVRQVVNAVKKQRFIPVWAWVVMFLLLMFAIRKRNS